MDPCGTPEVTAVLSDVCPSTLLLFRDKASIQSSSWPLINFIMIIIFYFSDMCNAPSPHHDLQVQGPVATEPPQVLLCLLWSPQCHFHPSFAGSERLAGPIATEPPQVLLSLLWSPQCNFLD